MNVQIDAIGVGLVSAAAPFLSVFLIYLGASNFQVSLLTAMPALTGFILALPLGGYLQRKRNIIPWFSASRLLVISCYTLTGLVTLLVPGSYRVIAVLVIWAWATIPQTMLNISFTVVMNAVAGPQGRFELMSRRWSILGFTTSITAIIVGQILDRIAPPLNYQVVFIALSVGGLISYYFSSRISLPPKDISRVENTHNFFQQLKSLANLIRMDKPFVSFILKRFVFTTGGAMTVPLFSIYYKRVLLAPDSWIAIFNMAGTAFLIIGYFIWMQQTRARGPGRVLLITTFALSLYPIFTAFTANYWLLAIYAGIVSIFQAGLNLVFFDELMKTIPQEYSATFVSVSQSLEYLSSFVSPMIGALLGDVLGISIAMVIGGVIRFSGFLLFAGSMSGIQKRLQKT
ncbi:MAG TPA: hypothetical protein VIO61_11760 [Anaerolineaceae bacterium]